MFTLQVEVDLALSAHANARRWYELKKKQESKQEKTVTAHEKAFKAAERKTRLQLSQVVRHHIDSSSSYVKLQHTIWINWVIHIERNHKLKREQAKDP